ncbi:MAG: type II toxin-antitoxin system Phd/YefM family antitoxin, partial [Mariprofundaceae bacterium]|nr:type II toxin-antitoxin system Phd/YefM family antitoxin [Mariprofundaceae bacterium]
PLSQLKARASELIRELDEQSEPIIITQNGKAKVVMQNIHAYEQTQETLALLKILALGNRQVEAGQTMSISDAMAAVRTRRQGNA